ncbi:MAG: SagB/ThcOx family dehydrogenase [Acidobacteria bacterium]|nr:SagB/ThcOx family dehydrogenase [Acidobacteriota bacterium]
MTWREYHDATKHSVESLRGARNGLDWANMPDPFRHYEGVPVLDLPAGPPCPDTPALDVLRGVAGSTPAREGGEFLSQLLFYSAAISAVKRVSFGGQTYALRVNPSSGNLHPTEFHFRTRGLKDWTDGLYHYRPSSHMAEQRARGDFTAEPLEFVLTSIAWREAWKYRSRAYRYCLLDMGHAWQALALAARAMGCEAVATGSFPDHDVAQSCRLPEDEWPLLLVSICGNAIPRDAAETVWYGGEANRLSDEIVPYPLIDGIHEATCLRAVMPSSSARPFGEVARTRRSAVDYQGGSLTMSREQLATILDAATRPLAADFAAEPFVQLCLYVHRVAGLEPGLYRHGRESGELELVQAGDQRTAAAGLSLGQDMAGNACVAFSMIADLERATRAHGDRGYRYAHFEAGAIGHRLYLAAEALGLRGTGIGAFYDDAVHRYLNLTPEQGQVVYHFALGHPAPDNRLI